VRRLAGALALLCVAGVVSACGIGPGPVTSHGKAQAVDQRLYQYSSKDLIKPDVVTSAADLVDRYLLAAADKLDSRLQTLRTYMLDKNWKPGSETINLYRVGTPQVGFQKTDGIIPVSVTMQRIGVFREGRIEPVHDGPTAKNFDAVERGADGFMLQAVPAELMLSDRTLGIRFEARPVYFWDKAGKRLVPDIRYVPRYMLEEEKAKLLLEYLYEGPPQWLAAAVKLPPAQVPLRSNPVYTSNGSLVIDLPNQLSEGDLARLTTQMERTLIFGQVFAVQLKIQGVPIPPGRSQTADDSGPAARFAVQSGKVVRVKTTPDRDAAALPLPTEINDRVVWASFSRREESVAMVKLVGNAQQFLIGPARAPTPLAMSGNKSVDHAMWLEGESRAALVLSDSKLFEVVPGQRPKDVVVTGQVTGPVSSFGLVPDGRITMVINKHLYIAALYRNQDGDLLMTPPQQVPTALDEVQHAALSRLEIVVAGVGRVDAKTGMIVTTINIDGSLQKPPLRPYEASQQISHLVTDFRSATSFYDFAGGAWQLSQSSAGPLLSNDLVGLDNPSSAPSASPAPTLAITKASFEG